MPGLLICIVDSTPSPQDSDQVSHPEAAQKQGPAGPEGSLWQRQWLFLRRRWWNTASLTLTQRVLSFVRGVILIAVGAIGLIVVVNNTLNLNSSGMDGVAKLMAEFLLIPVGLLAVIIAGYGLSQIVRSFLPNSMICPHPHSAELLEREEDQSEEFQVRDEDHL